jgi:hypothetical protein
LPATTTEHHSGFILQRRLYLAILTAKTAKTAKKTHTKGSIFGQYRAFFGIFGHPHDARRRFSHKNAQKMTRFICKLPRKGGLNNFLVFFAPFFCTF